MLPAGARTLLRVGDRCDDDEHEDREQDDAADRDPRHPRRAADEGQRQDQRDDEREHVAGAVAEDRAEGAAGGDLGGGREPAGAEEVADPEREDVVRPEPAEHERVEAAHGELERAGDAPPARRLRDVDELDHDRREQHEPDVGAPERAPDGVEIGVAEDEPEEERRRREPDREQRAAAPALARSRSLLRHCARQGCSDTGDRVEDIASIAIDNRQASGQESETLAVDQEPPRTAALRDPEVSRLVEVDATRSRRT